MTLNLTLMCSPREINKVTPVLALMIWKTQQEEVFINNPSPSLLFSLLMDLGLFIKGETTIVVIGSFPFAYFGDMTNCLHDPSDYVTDGHDYQPVHSILS